jgi:hypothetical protein
MFRMCGYPCRSSGEINYLEFVGAFKVADLGDSSGVRRTMFAEGTPLAAVRHVGSSGTCARRRPQCCQLRLLHLCGRLCPAHALGFALLFALTADGKLDDTVAGLGRTYAVSPVVNWQQAIVQKVVHTLFEYRIELSVCRVPCAAWPFVVSSDCCAVGCRCCMSATCAVAGRWLLVAGCWLLVAGCWLLVAGCWLLVAGCWLLGAGCWFLVAGCWLLVAGCWVLGAGCWVLGAGCWVLGRWVLGAECWVLGRWVAGCWVLDAWVRGCLGAADDALCGCAAVHGIT